MDKGKYKKDGTVCKSCFQKKERKNNKKTSSGIASNQQAKTKSNNNGTANKGFCNCCKTYLKKYFLLQKQEPIFTNTKSLNQHPNAKAQTSDEMQPLENYENISVVFDDALLSKQASNIDLFYNRGRHQIIDVYYTSPIYFIRLKNKIRIKSNTNISFNQTLWDIILPFHDIAGLDMNLQECKQFCRKALENECDYLQIDRFAQIEKGSYTFRDCNKTIHIECTTQTKLF